MYLKSLHVKRMKRLRDFRLELPLQDGEPRRWTVFIGENGTAKSSILQAIALAAAGSNQVNAVADRGVHLMRDRRTDSERMEVEAVFSFTEQARNKAEVHPLRPADPPARPSLLRSRCRRADGAREAGAGVIHLDLGPAPFGLAAARTSGLHRAARRLTAAGAGRRSDAIAGYRKPTAQALHDRQHGECAWCERPVGKTTQPVEHVRPKLGAVGPDSSGAAVLDSHHYWWLAWTWTHLVWACSTCNDQAHRGNHFPLEPGSARVEAPTFPVAFPLADQHFDLSGELRLLVHPREDDPLDHVVWTVVDRRQARSRWRWKVSWRDDRGETTRSILHLDELEDQVNAHLRLAVLGRDREIRQHLAAGRTAEATASWEEMLTTVLDDPAQPFRAASWCAIGALWPSVATAAHAWNRPARPVVRWRASP